MSAGAIASAGVARNQRRQRHAWPSSELRKMVAKPTEWKKKTPLKNPTADRRFFCVIFGRIQIDALVRSFVFFLAKGVGFFFYTFGGKKHQIYRRHADFGGRILFSV